MDVVQRQVPPDVADVAEVAQQLADDRLGLPAVGALEVAVLDDRDGRLERPANVVALGVDVDVEVDERLGACRAARGSAGCRGSSAVARKRSQVSERRAEGRAQDAELRLLELRARRTRASRRAARR